MGCLKRIGDKKYRIVYDLPSNGKRKQKTETLNGVTRPEAEAILAKRKAQVSSADYAFEEITISTLFVRFMQSRETAQCSPKTLERYGTLYASYIEPAFRSMLLKDLQPHHLVTAYGQWLKKGKGGKPLSPRTVRHIHNLVRGMLGYAVRKDLVARNVAMLVTEDLPKATKPDSVALTESELNQLLACAEKPSAWAKERGVISAQPWFAPAVWFAAFTGARRGETLSVRWSDLDLLKGTVNICRSLTETKSGLIFKAPKSGKSRLITISQSLVDVLLCHRALQEVERTTFGQTYQDQDLVFAKPDGTPVLPWSFTASFRYLVERAGVQRIRLHDLRDTHASLLAKAGVPIEVISKRLGHSDISITAERYLHIYMDRDAEAAGAFDRLLAA